MYELSVDFFEQKDDNYPSGMDTDESETSTIAEEDIEIVGTEISTQKNPVPGHSKRNSQPGAPMRPRKRLRSNPQTVNVEDDDEDESNAFSLSHPDFRKLVIDVASLKLQMTRRWSVDLLVSTGTKEDLDKIENEKNMNKIVFSGIEIHDLWAADLTWVVRLEKIKTAVTDFIKTIDPEGTYELGFIRHLNFKLKGIRQILEVTMGSEIQAKALCKAYGAKVKAWRENKDFLESVKGMSMGPSLTLATRVRIAILHALAKEIKSLKKIPMHGLFSMWPDPSLNLNLRRKTTSRRSLPWASLRPLPTTSRNSHTPICHLKTSMTPTPSLGTDLGKN